MQCQITDQTRWISLYSEIHRTDSPKHKNFYSLKRPEYRVVQFMNALTFTVEDLDD